MARLFGDKNLDEEAADSCRRTEGQVSVRRGTADENATKQEAYETGEMADGRSRGRILRRKSDGRTLQNRKPSEEKRWTKALYRRKSQVDNNDKRFVLHENTKIVSGE